MLGVDVSRYQSPAALPWAAWRDRVSVVVVQVTHGWAPEPNAAGHLAAAIANGYTLGCYHFLTPGQVAQQLTVFLQQLDPACQFCALDIEQDGITPQMVLAWCVLYDASCHLPLVLYGNNLLAACVAQYPVLAKYGVWWAQYPGFTPPAALRVIAHQYAGNDGRLAPYTGAIDLTNWFEIPGAPMVPVITHGSKIGIHAISPNQVIPLVKRAVAAGWHWPVVKMVNDASPLVDVKAISPQTVTIIRYMPSKDDEGLQDVQLWDDARRQSWAARLIQLFTSRTTAAQRAAIDYYDPTNEPGAHGVDVYRGYGLAYLELVRQANAAGLHLSVPALPQGTPEFSEMQAIVATGLFKAMKTGGHIWDCHEGVYGGQPADLYYGDQIPGTAPVAGAGAYNFRWRYLYSLLGPDERVPLVVSEFYDGGGYPGDMPGHVARFAWYDHLARQYPELLAFCGFTVDPDDHWRPISDYTPFYQSSELWAYIAAEKDKPNGDDEMQPLYHAKALQDLAIRDPQGNPAVDPVGAPPAAAGLAGVVKAGTMVHVYQVGVSAGIYQNRATINPNGASVWNVAGCLQKL